MPQPITKLVRDPYIAINSEALNNLPELATLVCTIFAKWASVKRELGTLLVRLLGNKDAVARAIFGILQTQTLQTRGLEAAARAALTTPEHHNAFLAALAVVGSAQKTRNKLAHWLWASCKQRPDLLLLGNSEVMKARDTRVIEYWRTQAPGTFNEEESYKVVRFDDDAFLAFTKTDLERTVRDISECSDIIVMVGMVIDPSFAVLHAKAFDVPPDAETIRIGVLARLNDVPSFRTALAQIHASQKSTP